MKNKDYIFFYFYSQLAGNSSFKLRHNAVNFFQCLVGSFDHFFIVIFQGDSGGPLVIENKDHAYDLIGT